MSLAHIVHEFGKATKRLIPENLPDGIDSLTLGLVKFNDDDSMDIFKIAEYNKTNKKLILNYDFRILQNKIAAGYDNFSISIEGVYFDNSSYIRYIYNDEYIFYVALSTFFGNCCLSPENTLNLLKINKPTQVEFQINVQNNYTFNILFNPI